MHQQDTQTLALASLAGSEVAVRILFKFEQSSKIFKSFAQSDCSQRAIRAHFNEARENNCSEVEVLANSHASRMLKQSKIALPSDTAMFENLEQSPLD